MAIIEETLQIGGNLKSTRRKLIGKDRMYELWDEQGIITHNFDEIIEVTERVYPGMYDRDIRPSETAENTNWTGDVWLVTKEEVGKALKRIKTDKGASDEGINVDLWRREDILYWKSFMYWFRNVWGLKKCA